MKKGSLLQLGTLAIGIAPFTMWGTLIQGATAGKTVSGVGQDDVDTATTINITYQTFCPWIVAGAAAFPAYNFVFASLGVASGIANIDPGDFTISQYNPWVVNNNNTTNNITGPDSANYNRGVTGQDAGGANIIVSYTPLNRGDPTSVNFVQAFIQNTNGAGFTSGVMDRGSSPTPYYNGTGVSGTGTTTRTGTIPFVTNSTTAAWLVDIPYRCENGNAANGDCTGGVDDTLTSQVQTFQTFIESDRVINGTSYNVLYGGVQWGYSFTAVETPEPSTILLFGSVLAAAGLRGYRRWLLGQRL